MKKQVLLTIVQHDSTAILQDMNDCKYRPTQNIFGPVGGRSIRVTSQKLYDDR